MLLVAVADTHGDKSTIGVPRAADVEEAISRAVKHAIEIKADAFFHLGDLTDPDSGGATFKAIEFMQKKLIQLSEHGIPSFIVCGNHDILEEGSGATVLTPMKALKWKSGGAAIYAIEDPVVITMQRIAFMFLPYTPIARSYDPARFARDNWPEGKVIVAGHLMLPGIIPGEETTEMPRGRDIVFPYKETTRAVLRMNGHIHKGQEFDPKDGGPPIVIPGAPCVFTIGEADNRPGFVVIEVDDE